ncbi:MAG: TolB-like 6-bladed beta-propeller domain-containing protein [Cytophagales bacterium]|nr:TolB-like 6-bladed beta-propeller domain-containing protein [Cytophagales bacterium]
MKFLYALFFCALFSCGEAEKACTLLDPSAVVFDEFSRTDSIKFRNLCSYKAGEVEEMFCMDSVLIIQDEKGEEGFFRNYYLKDGVYSAAYLQKGRGPEELDQVFECGFGKNCFFAYDANMHKVLLYNSEKLLADPSKLKPSVRLVKAKFYEMAVLNSTAILGGGEEASKYKLAKVDLSTGEKIKESGEYPMMAEKKMGLIKDAYTAYWFVKPSGDRLLLAYRYSDVVELFDTKKAERVKTVQGPDRFEVHYDAGERGGFQYMKKNGRTRKAFTGGGCATDQYVYLLYSGYKKKDGEKWGYGTSVFVYDWNAKPVRRIALDRCLGTIAVSPDDKALYSYDSETGYLLEASL